MWGHLKKLSPASSYQVLLLDIKQGVGTLFLKILSVSQSELTSHVQSTQM